MTAHGSTVGRTRTDMRISATDIAIYPSGDARRRRKGVRRVRKGGAARGGVPVERDPREFS